MIIELKAHIGGDGKIILHTPTELPPGEVEIVITYLTKDDERDEVLWDKQFAQTPASVFDLLIQQGLQAYHDGETDEFDPSQEDD